MDWITPDSLKTVAGSALAVTLLTAVVKHVLCIKGRPVQIIALVLAMVISLTQSRLSTCSDILIAVLNGLVIFASAVGIDQAVNYGGGTNEDIAD